MVVCATTILKDNLELNRLFPHSRTESYACGETNYEFSAHVEDTSATEKKIAL